MESIECRRCLKTKPKDLFPKNRRKCKECQKEMSKERRLKQKDNPKPEKEINPNSFKTCMNCTKVKMVSDFSKGRNECKNCRAEKLRESKKEKLLKINPEDTKKCTKCSEEKNILDFPVGRNKCKKCSNEEKRLSKAKRIEKEKNLKTKTCKKCNIEQDKSKFRDGEFTCWDCQKLILYKWRKENPDKVAIIEKNKRSKEGYKEKMNKYRKEKYHNDINEKYTRKYHMLLRSFLFKGSKSKSNNVFCCSREFFLHWIEDNMPLDIKWEDYGKIWHLDHIKPCSSFNLDNEAELLECFSWKNTIPLKASDNLIKHNKIDDDMIKLYKLKCSMFEKKYELKYQYMKPKYLKSQSNT